MIDLPDYGYVEHSVFFVDPGGVAEGSLGGPSDYIDRPGLRYGVRYTLRPLPSAKEARLFQSMLEQGLREDVSYAWPLDFKPPAAATSFSHIEGSNPVGGTISLGGLVNDFVFRVGQPLAVISGGVGYVHKVTAETISSSAGLALVPVYPLTRTTFINNDVVEIQHPRIRGRLTWDGSTQPAYGMRPFSFTITERK